MRLMTKAQALEIAYQTLGNLLGYRKNHPSKRNDLNYLADIVLRSANGETEVKLVCRPTGE